MAIQLLVKLIQREFFNQYLSIVLIIEVELSYMKYKNKIKSKLNKEKTYQ